MAFCSRAPLTASEQNAMGYGYWTDRHIDAERKLNLRAAVERAGADGEKLKEIRAQLAPLLRDTLLAFNYAYYAPPGAQILYTNPLFVRSHDFLGMPATPATWRITEMFGTGWPSNGGGRLVGSLSALPYALAEAEQNFLIPTHTQALIWGDLVPQMILSAKTPRWWTVTPSQLHWVGLHLRYGRELFGEAALDRGIRAQVAEALPRSPRRHAPARSKSFWRKAGSRRRWIARLPRNCSAWRGSWRRAAMAILPACWPNFTGWGKPRRKKSTTPPFRGLLAHPSRRWRIPTSRSC